MAEAPILKLPSCLTPLAGAAAGGLAAAAARPASAPLEAEGLAAADAAGLAAPEGDADCAGDAAACEAGADVAPVGPPGELVAGAAAPPQAARSSIAGMSEQKVRDSIDEPSFARSLYDVADHSLRKEIPP